MKAHKQFRQGHPGKLRQPPQLGIAGDRGGGHIPTHGHSDNVKPA